MLPSACGLGQHFQDLGHSFSLYGPPSRQITYIYYPTAPRRVQITPKTSTNMTRYLYSSGPIIQVCLLLTNQLAGFFAPIPFRFAYFCHAFPVNKYPRNLPTRTKNFGVLDNKSLIRRCVV